MTLFLVAAGLAVLLVSLAAIAVTALIQLAADRVCEKLKEGGGR